MKKYVKKNQKNKEKKVVSARINAVVANAFQNASNAANKMGYEINLVDVIEVGLRDAIDEFKQVSGTDYFELEQGRVVEQWGDKWGDKQSK